MDGKETTQALMQAYDVGNMALMKLSAIAQLLESLNDSLDETHAEGVGVLIDDIATDLKKNVLDLIDEAKDALLVAEGARQ
jgi:hypothetical protein